MAKGWRSETLALYFTKVIGKGLFVCLFFGGLIGQGTILAQDRIDEPRNKRAAIAEIYRSFQYERSLCPAILEKISSDTELVKELEAYSGDAASRIAESRIASDKVIQYLLAHQQYLYVEVYHHRETGYIYLKGKPIGCVQSNVRLKEIETFGESQEAWKIRTWFLDTLYRDLHILRFDDISEESDGVGLSYFVKSLEETKRIYTSRNYRAQLKSRIVKLTTRIKAERELAKKANMRELAAKICSNCRPGQSHEKEIIRAEQIVTEYVAQMNGWLDRLQRLQSEQ